MFSLLVPWRFKSPLHDVYCGLRSRKDIFYVLDQCCTGMEFATEMMMKASLYRAKLPKSRLSFILTADRIVLLIFKLSTTAAEPHDFSLTRPRWLMLVPGSLLILQGMAGFVIAMPGLTLRGVSFDAHTLLFASLVILCGYQSVAFAILTKTFAIAEGLLPEDPRMNRLFELVNLERESNHFFHHSSYWCRVVDERNQPLATGKLWKPRLCADHATGSSRGNSHSFRVSNDSLKFRRKYFRNAPLMMLVDLVHDDYVATGRDCVLSDRPAKLFPIDFLCWLSVVATVWLFVRPIFSFCRSNSTFSAGYDSPNDLTALQRTTTHLQQ